MPPPPNPTPPQQAKVISLRVRPFGVSHLSFETDGILGDLNLTLNPNALGLLGATVPAFDFDLFYGILASAPTQPATGSITFTTNPAAGTTIILGGTTWRFVSSLSTGNQLPIATTLAGTLAAAVKVLQASTDTNTKKFRFDASTTVLNVTAAIGGDGGNLLTLSTTVSGAITSGSTLSGGDSSRLLYDFPQIQAFVAPYTLVTLRAEPRKAALNKATNMRQNAYFAKYGNLFGPTGIIKTMEGFFSWSVAGTKSDFLNQLDGAAEDQWNQLRAAYAPSTGPQRKGVVQNTISTITSDTTSYGYSTASGKVADSVGSPKEKGGTWNSPPEPPGPSGPPQPWPPMAQPQYPDAPLPVVLALPNFPPSDTTEESYQETTSYETNSNQGAAHQNQTITNTDYGYRVPYDEAWAQYARAKISLIDQQFAAYMYAQNLPNLGVAFGNELASIDGDIYRLQIAYLNTILMSPIPGIVTGVYKNPGEMVRAGEPVIRVENYTVILLEAVLIFRGQISIGQTLTVTTALFDVSSGQPTSISGLVVAARGHSDDDQWNVIVECNNMDGSNPPKPIFPLGYRFDYDNTKVLIT